MLLGFIAFLTKLFRQLSRNFKAIMLEIKLLMIFILSLQVATSQQLHGEPKQILNFETGTDANVAVLKEILDRKALEDHKVVVVSIAGPYRKGKSFFMNYCLRFMYANVSASRFI